MPGSVLDIWGRSGREGKVISICKSLVMLLRKLRSFSLLQKTFIDLSVWGIVSSVYGDFI